MNTRYFLSLSLAAAALTACAGSTATDSLADGTKNSPNGNGQIVAGSVEVKATRPNLTLRNTTETVVGYMVVDSEMATVALFPPCDQRCPQIVQGASATVPYTAIAGYTNASKAAIVMWWTYRRGADGTLQPDGGVQSSRVTL
ncbi:MAG TPA: hypothetical protein VGE27_02755 [Gemmatimonas sp.]|uniref:hypothetical protein n=1 Tax=Gemmatimonas sp. TaxID=1962908 RepID=UPI002EDB84A4